jgi:hypothetical protein
VLFPSLLLVSPRFSSFWVENSADPALFSTQNEIWRLSRAGA